MDRTAIKTLIQAAGFGSDTAEAAAQDTILTAVLLELSGEREWSWLNKTATLAVLTIGSATVTSPTDLAYPKHLRLAQSSIALPRLRRLDDRKILDWLHFDQANGRPHTWGWVNSGIVVFPRPDFAYATELDYIKVPDLTTFDTAAESPPFELRFHTVLAWGSLRWLAIRRRDAALYQIVTGEYTRARQQFEQADRPPQQTHVAEWDGWAPVR